MNSDQIENEIRALGLNAPRITPQDVETEIVSTEYTVMHRTTVCCLLLKNGFTVLGESACASPENFNADLGRKLALLKAKEKVWWLLGFRLRDKLSGL